MKGAGPETPTCASTLESPRIGPFRRNPRLILLDECYACAASPADGIAISAVRPPPAIAVGGGIKLQPGLHRPMDGRATPRAEVERPALQDDRVVVGSREQQHPLREAGQVVDLLQHLAPEHRLALREHLEARSDE